MDTLLEQLAGSMHKLQHFTVKTASRASIADRFLLEADQRSAIALIMALRTLYGIDVLYWEPETIQMSLKDDGIDVSTMAMDKIMAGITVMHNPTFFWDNLAFQRTVQALNDVPYDPETLQECAPAHMAWGMYEATLLRGLDPEEPEALPEMDEDVQQYVAVCLKRAGFIYPPTVLREVEDNLKNMLPDSSRLLVQHVKQSWSRLNKDALQDRVFPEDVLGVQLSLLAAAFLYERRKAGNMAKDVMELEQG
jgi:hypothetical protein